MENMGEVGFYKKPENIVDKNKEKEINLSGPEQRIFDGTKKELGMLFGFGLKSIEEDIELLDEINRQFLENNGYLENKLREWNLALSDVNKDAQEVERLLAKNFAENIFSFITKESKLKNRFNN